MRVAISDDVGVDGERATEAVSVDVALKGGTITRVGVVSALFVSVGLAAEDPTLQVRLAAIQVLPHGIPLVQRGCATAGVADVANVIAAAIAMSRGCTNTPPNDFCRIENNSLVLTS